jgi:hypothetical protein
MPPTPRQVLEVHLVADARVRGDHLEVLEGRLAPAKEGVALAVALELELGVSLEGEALGEDVHLDRVVDDELHRHQRVDPLRIAAQLVHRVAHRGEVHDGRHAREILHQHARGGVGDLARGLVGCHPGGEVLDVARRDRAAVLATQEVLEQDLQRVGQPRHVEAGLKRFEAKDLVRPTADREVGPRAEAVRMSHGFNPIDGPSPDSFRACMTWRA